MHMVCGASCQSDLIISVEERMAVAQLQSRDRFGGTRRSAFLVVEHNGYLLPTT